jgi:hypothetical protein
MPSTLGHIRSGRCCWKWQVVISNLRWFLQYLAYNPWLLRYLDELRVQVGPYCQMADSAQSVNDYTFMHIPF